MEPNIHIETNLGCEVAVVFVVDFVNTHIIIGTAQYNVYLFEAYLIRSNHNKETAMMVQAFVFLLPKPIICINTKLRYGLSSQQADYCDTYYYGLLMCIHRHHQVCLWIRQAPIYVWGHNLRIYNIYAAATELTMRGSLRHFVVVYMNKSCHRRSKVSPLSLSARCLP